MPDEQFFSLLTNIGEAQLTNALALGGTVDVTELAVGDGEAGAYYTPTEAQTALKNEVYRGTINNKYVHAQNANWVVFELAIPADEGPWTVREAGIFDSGGNMIAVAKLPETYKPALAQGSGKDLLIKFILQTANASQLNLLIDPSVVLATHDKVAQDISSHDGDGNAHQALQVPQATETVVGKVELAAVVEAKAGTDTVRAVTPAGLGAVMSDQRKRDMLERLISAMQDSSANPAMNAKPETYEDLSGLYVNEVLKSPTNMTADNAPAPLVAASSGAAAPQYPYVLWDGNDVTNALNTGTVPTWWSLDLGAGNEEVVTRYEITLIAVARNPTAWNFQGSNDNSNWDDLDTQSGVSWQTHVPQSWSFDNTTAYRYYRLYATAGSSGTHVGEMYSLDMYGSNPGGSEGFVHDAAGAFVHNPGTVDMTLISTSIEAFAEPVTGFLLGLWEPVDPVTYDADVLGDLSKDDGTTWEDVNVAKIAEATVDVAGMPTVVDVVYGEVTFAASGDQTMRSRLRTLNAKHVKFHGTIMDAE